ncbi:MAG: hypothetical protein CSB21_03630 [Deltaproteobacteria bacterium]|nr:MAG: hypothetical protein CSB21_03630 [Deltaproteobacteria bacterium]
MKKVLLFVMHGMRDQSSNKEALEFFNKIRPLVKIDVDVFTPCFLAFGKPDIVDGLEDAFEKGARKAYIFPYFLFEGAHVKKAIPDIISVFSEKHPEVEIEILPIFGDVKNLKEFVAKGLEDEMKNK